MPEFVKSIEIGAPVSALFQFHGREDALELLSSAFPPVKVIRKSGGIQVGAQVELRIMGFHWTALHTQHQKDRLFVDEQIRGPFAKWIHRHEFEDLGGGKSRLTDRVEYELPGGRIVNAIFGWAIKPGLSQMFRHRHQVTAKALQ